MSEQPCFAHMFCFKDFVPNLQAPHLVPQREFFFLASPHCRIWARQQENLNNPRTRMQIGNGRFFSHATDVAAGAMSRQQRSKKVSQLVLTHTVLYSSCSSTQRMHPQQQPSPGKHNHQTVLLQHFFTIHFSNTSPQHFPSTLLYDILLPHFSTTLFSNTCLQHSSPTLLHNTSLQHFSTTFLSHTPLQRSSPTLVYNTLL